MQGRQLLDNPKLGFRRDARMATAGQPQVGVLHGYARMETAGQPQVGVLQGWSLLTKLRMLQNTQKSMHAIT